LQYLKAIYETSHNDRNVEALINLSMKATSNDLKYFALVRAGRRFYELNYFQDAKRSFWNAKNYIPTITMSEYLEEQIELCDFVSTNME
jgi:hypothetical protein